MYNAVVRAELTQCAHRNRPLRYDGRVVVTLCADEVLYLPVTTEIASLPQLTPKGLPLALARREASVTRMSKAAAELEERGESVTARTLAAAAHISLNTACAWLRQRETGAPETEPMLSVVQYRPYSASDNISAVENNERLEVPEQAPAAVDSPEAAPPDEASPLLALRYACLAASAPAPVAAPAQARGSVRRVAGSTAGRAIIRGESTRSVVHSYRPAPPRSGEGLSWPTRGRLGRAAVCAWARLPRSHWECSGQGVELAADKLWCSSARCILA